MRYAIEKTRLSGQRDSEMRITFHKEDAPSLLDALRSFSSREKFELLGDLTTVGSEGVAAARRNDDVFLLRFSAEE